MTDPKPQASLDVLKAVKQGLNAVIAWPDRA